jgi:hypothetical protein
MESRRLVPAAADFQKRENAAHQDHCNNKAVADSGGKELLTA